MHKCIYVFSNNLREFIDKFKVGTVDHEVQILTKEEALKETRATYLEFQRKDPSNYPDSVDTIPENYLLEACANVYSGTVHADGSIWSRINPNGLFISCEIGGTYDFALHCPEGYDSNDLEVQDIDWDRTKEPDLWCMQGEVYSKDTGNFKEMLQNENPDTLVTVLDLLIQ